MLLKIQEQGSDISWIIFIESLWKTIFKNSSLKVLEKIEKNQKKKFKYVKNPQTFFKIQVYYSKSPRKLLKQFLKNHF